MNSTLNAHNTFTMYTKNKIYSINYKFKKYLKYEM